jgi:prepilin-type N-terminal cleavage/methylation domain-containing protein
MRSPHSRLPAASYCDPRRTNGWRAPGFSMVELLVTIIIASIIFAAMVPFFANALKRTSQDELRVDSTNIAQDRIEQIRLLDYGDVTVPNLSTTDATFGDGRFGPGYTLVGESKPYTVTYEVTPADAGGDVPQKVVSVRVTRDDGFVTTARTIIQNPAAGESTSSDAEPTDLTMTVYFDNASYVKAPGVVIRRVRTNVTPNATTTPAPSTPWTSGATQVKYAGLIGGPNYTYTIMCHSNKASYVLTAPPFRMWSSGRLKFDTYPGGD